MKTISLSVMVVMAAVSLCFAQQAPVASSKGQSSSAVSVVAPSLTLSGKVKAVTQADIVKGTKSMITVTDSTGKDDVFMILASTVIIDKDGMQVPLDKITTVDSVRVKYIQTKEGVKEAVKVTVQK